MALIKNAASGGEGLRGLWDEICTWVNTLVVGIVLHCGSAVARTGFPGLILQKGWQWPGEAKMRNFGYMDIHGLGKASQMLE